MPRPPGDVAAVALSAVGAALVVLGLGATGLAPVDGLSICIGGVFPALAGVVVVRAARRPRDLARTVLGSALVIYGAGQLALVAQAALQGVAVDRLPVPAVGDAVSSLAAPLAVAGLVLLPVRAHPLERTRIGLDAALITTAASMALWELWFREALPSGLSPAALPPALLLLASLGLMSLVLVTAVRDLDAGLALTAVGLLVHVAADAVALLGPSGPRWWVSSAVSCVALSVAAVGLRLGSGSEPVRPGRRRRQATALARTTTSTLTALLVMLYLAAVMPGGPDGMSLAERRVPLVLAEILLVIHLAREMLRAQQTQELLERLDRKASTDPLTGLGNRRALTDALARSAEQDRGIGLVTIDLDGFKDVNRLLGHGTGDVLLRRVGDAMTEALDGRRARAFRMGGDEFAVLVDGTEHDATLVAEHLLEVTRSLGRDIPGVGRVALSASIGVAAVLNGHAGRDGGPVQALELSGEAMRVSKALGRGRVTHYTDRMAQGARRRVAVERRLRDLVADGGADIVYQPVIDVPTGSVVGVEALARWHDDELGDVPPLEFIGIAENCGLMPELGLQLLRSAMRGHVASGACGRGVTLGVNLSTLQLRMPGFAATVIAMAQAHDVPFDRLVAEVTESVLLDDGDPAVAAVYELAAAGMPIALDDFGTGYSSLAYLHRLPVAILKIDRVMTLSMETPRGQAIARSVADMGAALGVDVVVEGVETEVQAGLVADLGIPYAQGWLYAQALTPDELRCYLAGRVTLAELADAAPVAGPVP